MKIPNSATLRTKKKTNFIRKKCSKEIEWQRPDTLANSCHCKCDQRDFIRLLLILLLLYRLLQLILPLHARRALHVRYKVQNVSSLFCYPHVRLPTSRSRPPYSSRCSVVFLGVLRYKHQVATPLYLPTQVQTYQPEVKLYYMFQVSMRHL